MNIKVVLIALFLGETIGKFEIFPKVPNFLEYGNNKLCKIESNIYKKNLRNYTVWAHKMFDSSAKKAFGVLSGNDYQLGNYEECLNIRGPFPTQYCLVRITLSVPPRNLTSHMLDQYGSVLTKLENFRIKNLKLGLCFPSSCSASDIQESLIKTLNKVENPLKIGGIAYNVSSSQELCSDYIHPKKLGKLQMTFCTLTAVLIFMVLIGTMWDCLKTKKRDPSKIIFLKKLCLSFSARTSWNELFKSYGNQKETRIFDGVRSISITVIFVAHLLATISLVPRLNGLIVDEVFHSRIFYVIENLDLFVDIFFVMSGLLLVYRIMKNWNDVNVSSISMVFFRYVRLTPLHMYVTLYYTAMLAYTGSGPVWNLIYIDSIRKCEINNYWWLNFFYISNFMKESLDSCNNISWFIVCDFQLYILGVMVMCVMQKNLRAGYGLLGLLFVLSIIASFILTRIYDIMPHLGTYGSEDFSKYWNLYYVKPYTRGSSYIVGMVGGIVYNKLISMKTKISKIISYAIIGISLLIMITSFAYLIVALHGEENYKFEFALYNALHRPLWCIGILGIFIVASFGSIPALRLFLSSSFWTPLSKLSYGFYLIHFMIQTSIITTSVTVMHSNLLYTTILLFIAVYAMSFVLAFFLYCIVEAPFLRIFQAILLVRFYNTQKPLKNEDNKFLEEGMTPEIETIPEKRQNQNKSTFIVHLNSKS